MKKFNHRERHHNTTAPEVIIPEIIKFINPKSVVDFGCGLGAFLFVCKQNGIQDILGIDGEWTDKKLLSKYLNQGEFEVRDLEQEIKLKKKYDLAISLEVAEHLSESSAETFVQSLVNAGQIILFAAAIPNQGGDGHINEQWLTYWEQLFLKHNYVIHDVVRPIFWDNPKLSYWYKQNMVIVAPKGFKFKSEVNYSLLRNVVHYELYEARTKELQTLMKDRLRIKHNLKLFLRSVMGDEKFEKMIQRRKR